MKQLLADGQGQVSIFEDKNKRIPLLGLLCQLLLLGGRQDLGHVAGHLVLHRLRVHRYLFLWPIGGTRTDSWWFQPIK